MSLCARTTINGPHRLLSRPPHVVRCVGTVNAAMTARFTKAFGRAVASGQRFIPVVIKSAGGNLVDALEIVAAIKTCPVPVATIVNSEALSAGALIFSAGSEGLRFAGPYATFMIHQVSLDGVSGSAKTVAIESRELQRVNGEACRLMAENTGHLDDPGYYTRMLADADGDVYLDATAAVHHGLASLIATPHLEVALDVRLELVVEPRWDNTGCVLDVGAAGQQKATASANVLGKRKRPRTTDTDGNSTTSSDEDDDDDEEESAQASDSDSD